MIGLAPEEKVGRVVSSRSGFGHDGGSWSYFIREMTEECLWGPEWHVFSFQIKKVGLSPLEILARS
jgi:hypothetical protein